MSLVAIPFCNFAVIGEINDNEISILRHIFVIVALWRIWKWTTLGPNHEKVQKWSRDTPVAEPPSTWSRWSHPKNQEAICMPLLFLHFYRGLADWNFPARSVLKSSNLFVLKEKDNMIMFYVTMQCFKKQ